MNPRREGPPVHAPTERADIKYLPQYCPFLTREVWALLTRQPDQRWRIVNCLDKDRACFKEPCAFTTDGGEWPFRASPEDVNPSG